MKHFDRLYKTILESIKVTSKKSLIKEQQEEQDEVSQEEIDDTVWDITNNYCSKYPEKIKEYLRTKWRWDHVWKYDVAMMKDNLPSVIKVLFGDQFNAYQKEWFNYDADYSPEEGWVCAAYGGEVSQEEYEEWYDDFPTCVQEVIDEIDGEHVSMMETDSLHESKKVDTKKKVIKESRVLKHHRRIKK